MGEKELMAKLTAALEEWGCEISVEVNEEIWFYDPEGRLWVVALHFKNNPPGWGEESSQDRAPDS